MNDNPSDRPNAIITLVETAYFTPTRANADAQEINNVTTVQVLSQEQAYQRWMTLTESPAPVDTGWLDKARMLIVENDSETAVEIVTGGIPLVVDPGQCQRVVCDDVKRLALRSRGGNVRIKVTVFPV